MNEFELKLRFITGRSDEDNWEVHQVEDIRFWKEAVDLISLRECQHNGCMISIESDWRPVIDKLEKDLKRNVQLHSGEEVALGDIGDVTEVPVKILISGTNDLSGYFWYPNLFLEYYVYEIFFVLNLSRPGVCDFFSLSLEGVDNPWQKKSSKIEHERISSYNLEFAWENSFRGLFPSLKEIPINDVINWYEKIDIGLKQKATRPIEKTLFSFYHICKADGDISSIVWVFHALESLYSTKVGEGFSNLINRISALLSLDEKQVSILKKNLRKLYDMRSSLIHGGYEIYHPMRNEVVDKTIENQYSEIYENHQFGISILIASLQALIEKRWYRINVIEQLDGSNRP
ncbi:HEPN domain-containing protein [Bowmanella dokdonensis]|uniref:Apea-like HEPN domain-containing protein n=1 Tax=Bowmanella dokdonensis TaxID=751969 RepID=A0A939DRR6_9ALTE|nr:HEPN domain-containing protein [Bowmanella dokdonensis]MBN7827020.1 hypothetical protein [Bowmanella dokdonensis]